MTSAVLFKLLLKVLLAAQERSCPSSLDSATDGLGQLGLCTTRMREAVCHEGNKIMFTISIPNTKHINNAKVTVVLFKDTSLRTRDQHFGCQCVLRALWNVERKAWPHFELEERPWSKNKASSINRGFVLKKRNLLQNWLLSVLDGLRMWIFLLCPN